MHSPRLHFAGKHYIIYPFPASSGGVERLNGKLMPRLQQGLTQLGEAWQKYKGGRVTFEPVATEAEKGLKMLQGDQFILFSPQFVQYEGKTALLYETTGSPSLVGFFDRYFSKLATTLVRWLKPLKLVNREVSYQFVPDAIPVVPHPIPVLDMTPLSPQNVDPATLN